MALQLNGSPIANRRVQVLPPPAGAEGFDDTRRAPALEGRRFLALYQIECDDVEAMRDRIQATSGDRTHSDLLELDPLPITLLFESIDA